MTTKAQHLLSKVPYHAERLYALIRNNGGISEMCYVLGTSKEDVYRDVVQAGALGSGTTVETLRQAGWVARPVYVEERGSAS